ncbi:hypothetical protein GZH46_01095 [Fragariocoptes setiger]|uniref:Uncharacterized protein n=1 Tax=Fragariocoptes setiger TaxID=1670756 RepID=A0ABQ7SAD6_9ACAR|nr:hypothetical protein GZH46_01095 [Fragariocoptes setiger]
MDKTHQHESLQLCFPFLRSGTCGITCVPGTAQQVIIQAVLNGGTRKPRGVVESLQFEEHNTGYRSEESIIISIMSAADRADGSKTTICCHGTQIVVASSAVANEATQAAAASTGAAVAANNIAEAAKDAATAASTEAVGAQLAANAHELSAANQAAIANGAQMNAASLEANAHAERTEAEEARRVAQMANLRAAQAEARAQADELAAAQRLVTAGAAGAQAAQQSHEAAVAQQAANAANLEAAVASKQAASASDAANAANAASNVLTRDALVARQAESLAAATTAPVAAAATMDAAAAAESVAAKQAVTDAAVGSTIAANTAANVAATNAGTNAASIMNAAKGGPLSIAGNVPQMAHAAMNWMGQHVTNSLGNTVGNLLSSAGGNPIGKAVGNMLSGGAGGNPIGNAVGHMLGNGGNPIGNAVGHMLSGGAGGNPIGNAVGNMLSGGANPLGNALSGVSGLMGSHEQMLGGAGRMIENFMSQHGVGLLGGAGSTLAGGAGHILGGVGNTLASVVSKPGSLLAQHSGGATNLLKGLGAPLAAATATKAAVDTTTRAIEHTSAVGAEQHRANEITNMAHEAQAGEYAGMAAATPSHARQLAQPTTTTYSTIDYSPPITTIAGTIMPVRTNINSYVPPASVPIPVTTTSVYTPPIGVTRFDYTQRSPLSHYTTTMRRINAVPPMISDAARLGVSEVIRSSYGFPGSTATMAINGVPTATTAETLGATAIRPALAATQTGAALRAMGSTGTFAAGSSMYPMSATGALNRPYMDATMGRNFAMLPPTMAGRMRFMA